MSSETVEFDQIQKPFSLDIISILSKKELTIKPNPIEKQENASNLNDQTFGSPI